MSSSPVSGIASEDEQDLRTLYQIYSNYHYKKIKNSRGLDHFLSDKRREKQIWWKALQFLLWSTEKTQEQLWSTCYSFNYPIQGFKPHSKPGFCSLPVKLKAAPIALHVFTCTAWDMAQEVGPVCNVSSYLGHWGPQTHRSKRPPCLVLLKQTNT